MKRALCCILVMVSLFHASSAFAQLSFGRDRLKGPSTAQGDFNLDPRSFTFDPNAPITQLPDGATLTTSQSFLSIDYNEYFTASSPLDISFTLQWTHSGPLDSIGVDLFDNGTLMSLLPHQPFVVTSDPALATGESYTLFVDPSKLSGPDSFFGLNFNITDGDASGGDVLRISSIQANAPVASVTPAPATLVLLGTGLLGIGGVVRRRRRNSIQN